METAHKLIISWGMTAGAWSRGSIKLSTENLGPGGPGSVHRCQSCWPLARKVFHWGPGMAGWNWSSFCNPLDGDLAFYRKCTSFCCGWSCCRGCCSSIVVDSGCFGNCSVVWNFDSLADPYSACSGERTSFGGFAWHPRHCLLLLPVGQLESWTCPGPHLLSKVWLWPDKLLYPDPGSALAAGWWSSWGLEARWPGTGWGGRTPPLFPPGPSCMPVGLRVSSWRCHSHPGLGP